MGSQTIIITGATQGLGYYAAQTLAKQGFTIIMAGRNARKNEAAANQIRQATSNRTVYAMTLDLASLASVRQFVAAFTARTDLPPLFALVNNAGLQVVGPTEFTEDGVEMTFGVNHLGHFLLTKLLLPHFSETARIVVVSSGTHDPNEPLAKAMGVIPPDYTNADDLAHPKPTAEDPAKVGTRRYSTSKLCNLLFAYELNRQLAGQGRTGITVNAYDPGLMPGSGLARQYGPVLKWIWNNILPIMRLIPRVGSTQTSGALLAQLTSDPAFTNVTGSYFYFNRPGDMRQQPSSDDSYNLTKAQDLWETSEKLTASAKQPA